MVMEAQPSPQCVGREFVRQYYTLLNKAPTHLHRFYNHQSSFVHGGLDPPNRETTPMIGQKQIHQKIQQLNFQDCHAKITQVDSQATLGNGVVVQVTGELSNAGQPMRRFTQTFVLAAQSPKKYYVHNDIFRYQDEVYTDEECDPESGRSEAEEEIVPNQNLQEPPQQLPQQPMSYYNPNATPMQAPNIVPHHPPQMAPVMPATPAVASVNGVVHPEDILPPVIAGTVAAQPPHLTGQGIPSSHTPLSIPQTMPATQQPIPPTVIPQEEEPPIILEQQPEIEPSVPEENFAEENIPEKDEQIVQEEPPQQEPVISNEPKTYATLVKSGGSSGQMFTSAMSMNQNQTSKSATSPPPPNRTDNRDSGLGGVSPGQPLGQRNNLSRGARQNNTGNRNMSRQDSRGQNRTSFNDDGGMNYFSDDRRRSAGGNTGNSHYGDANQLFMGNLPHSATEDDLREIFSQFGTVVDLRIHSKPASKGAPIRTPPNYGFVTFEDQQSVQSCLQASSMLVFPPNSENGQKLNVEEKKTRPRQSVDGGRMNSGGDNTGLGRPNSGLGPRPGGGNNMMRGGPGGMGHRGHPRGGGNFQRSDNRNQNMSRGTNNYNRR